MSDDLVKRLRGWARDIHEGSTAIWAMDQDLKRVCAYIEELEAKLALRTGEADAKTTIIKELEAKLAKAVEEAFFEGFCEGRDGDWVWGDPTPAWEKSDSFIGLKG